MLDYAADAGFWGYAADETAEEAARLDALTDALALAVVGDAMDAPSDWDMGTVCFDPYVA